MYHAPTFPIHVAQRFPFILETNQTASSYRIGVIMNRNRFNQDRDQRDPQVLGILQYETTCISIPNTTAWDNSIDVVCQDLNLSEASSTDSWTITYIGFDGQNRCQFSNSSCRLELWLHEFHHMSSSERKQRLRTSFNVRESLCLRCRCRNSPCQSTGICTSKCPNGRVCSHAFTFWCTFCWTMSTKVHICSIFTDTNSEWWLKEMAFTIFPPLYPPLMFSMIPFRSVYPVFERANVRIWA